MMAIISNNSYQINIKGHLLGVFFLIQCWFLILIFVR